MAQQTTTVLGETTGLAGTRQRHLQTPDGRRWVISAYRGRFFPEGQTLVFRATENGDFDGDDVVEINGFDLDAAQAEFERRYRAGLIPDQVEPCPEHLAGERATEEACRALSEAVEAALAGRLHVVPDL